MATSRKQKSLDFDTAIRELETLVEAMEQGDVSLEESIKQFERGIALARTCQQALSAAEQKVAKLAGQGTNETLEAFAPDDD